MKRLLAASVLVSVLVGCAWNKPVLRETVTSTNGIVTTRTMTITTFALWPATTALEKQKASLGKTFSVGTTGLDAEGGGTNVVAALQAIDSILGKIKP